MSNNQFGKNANILNTLFSDKDSYKTIELESRLADTIVFDGRSAAGFEEAYFDELCDEAEELGYVTPVASNLTRFEEAVEGLVKASGINKPKDISILLASALLAKNEDAEQASLSCMYQIWYQNCHALFIQKYSPKNPSELSPVPAAKAA